MIFELIVLAVEVSTALLGPYIYLYALAGVVLACLVGRKTRGALRLASVTFVLALFFSISLVPGRLVVPVPSLAVIALWTWDSVATALKPLPCPPEGCISDDELGVALFLVPLIVQWLALFVLVLAGAELRAWIRRRWG